MVCVVVVASTGWMVLGVVLGVSYGVKLGPAVVKVWRSSDLSGVSPATWGLSGAESVVWGVFGWAVADGPILVYAMSGVLASVLILVRLGTFDQASRIG